MINKKITINVIENYQKRVEKYKETEDLIEKATGTKPCFAEISATREIEDSLNNILNSIAKIKSDYIKIKAINKRLENMEIVQDIYIDAYTMYPVQELYLAGNNILYYIHDIEDVLLPGDIKKIFDKEQYNKLKAANNLSDDKMYIKLFDEFHEVKKNFNAPIDKNDIFGTLLEYVINKKAEIKYKHGIIEIDLDITIPLNLDHLRDWVNNKSQDYYKITYLSLLEYERQLKE